MDILLAGLGGVTAGTVDRVLAARGHVRTMALGGVDALQALERAFPFVVIEDPLFDAHVDEFCRRARATVHGPDAVILVVTHRDEDFSPVLDAGATDLYSAGKGTTCSKPPTGWTRSSSPSGIRVTCTFFSLTS